MNDSQRIAAERAECMELTALVLASSIPGRVKLAQRILARGMAYREPDDRRHWLE